jgi:proton-coupled amino acid transporter
MSSPLPVNAKQNWSHGDSDGVSAAFPSDASLSSSYDRNRTTARLTSSPVPPNYAGGTSPPTGGGGFFEDGLSHRSYGSTTDLQQVPSNHSGTTGLFRPMSTPTYNHEDNTVSADLTDDRIARVVKRHLAGASSPTGSNRSSSPNNKAGLSRVSTNHSHHSNNHNPIDWEMDENAGTSSSLVANAHQLPGGAITYDLYKWAEDQDMEQIKRQRSQSMYIPRQEPTDPALARLKDPGGFRRHFIVDKAAREGKQPPHWMTRTFVDFLALYGHFGGEDLSDDEGEEDDDEGAVEEGTAGLRPGDGGDEGEEDETSPLIRKAQANAVQGTATPSKAVFLLLKSFVGTGKRNSSSLRFCPLTMISFFCI